MYSYVLIVIFLIKQPLLIFFLYFQRFAFKGVVDDVFVRFRQSDSSMGRMPTLQISDKNGEIGSIKIVYHF